MKITLFTANNLRHNYLINLLSTISDELFVVQECSTIFQGIVPGHYPASDNMKKYFSRVNKAQSKFFEDPYIKANKKIRLMPILLGDLNKLSPVRLSDFLNSDIYIVFGSSFIKGELAEFLISKKAINIHMGISPFYRGCDCNFWALFDGNPHLVGATIHMLSKGLDSGPILYHALSKISSNPFEYSMSTVKSAFHSIVDRVSSRKIFDIKTELQDKTKEIRYSRKDEFNEEVVQEYFNKKINLNSKSFDHSLLKDPYFFEED